MLTLAIDTTANTASCALYDGGIIAQSSLNAKITHSATLLPMIDSMLKCARVEIKDVELLCASVGPGSFTGVRIGVSLMLGLAFDRCVPCVGVSTLEALAYNVKDLDGDFIICPVMDARRNQFYNSLFTPGKVPLRLLPDRAISAEELKAELLSYNKPIMPVGDGYALSQRELDGVNLLKVPEALSYQLASSVAACAIDKYNAAPDKSVFNDSSLRPVYLRSSQAERCAAANIKD